MQPHGASITIDGHLLTVAEDGRTVARRDNRRDAVLPRDYRRVREDPAARPRGLATIHSSCRSADGMS